MTKILVNIYMEVSLKERRSRAPLTHPHLEHAQLTFRYINSILITTYLRNIELIVVTVGFCHPFSNIYLQISF